MFKRFYTKIFWVVHEDKRGSLTWWSKDCRDSSQLYALGKFSQTAAIRLGPSPLRHTVNLQQFNSLYSRFPVIIIIAKVQIQQGTACLHHKISLLACDRYSDVFGTETTESPACFQHLGTPKNPGNPVGLSGTFLVTVALPPLLFTPGCKRLGTTSLDGYSSVCPLAKVAHAGLGR